MRLIKCTFAVVCALWSISCAAIDDEASEPHQLLDKLVGEWALSGTMGATVIAQEVTGEWVLGGRFVKMHFIQTGEEVEDGDRYEAIYLIGYDGGADEFVINLFDTFGPEYARYVGTGRRHEDSIRFRFEYPGGPFENTFVWNPERGTWRMDLRGFSESGGWTDFATKTMTRR